MDPLEDKRAFIRAIAPRFVVERVIGSGGWGTVFAARDAVSGAMVAIKVPTLDPANDSTRRRFLREIAIARRLDHPGIVPLLDFGEHDGHPYFVMPLVGGPSLRDRLATGGVLSVSDALRIARDVADALAYAHALGIVHRDIKPGNIMLPGERAMVLDFGIARALAESNPDGPITSTGILIGTPAYMSPEQASGGRELDPRSDLYSLGVVLYEMLAGQPPFSGPSERAVFARHASDPVPPLRTVRPSIPPSVEQVVYRALAKVPADRFVDAADMRDALTTAARDPLRSVVADVEAPGRGGGTRRRTALLVGSGAVAALAMLAARTVVAGRESRLLAKADSTRWLVAADSLAWTPAERRATLGDARRAFRSWRGVAALDGGDGRDDERADASRDDLIRRAIGDGARRIVLLSHRADGGTQRLRMQAYDAGEPMEVLAEAEVPWPTQAAARDSALRRLVAAALVRPTLAPVLDDFTQTTSSAPARQAFVRGATALHAWRLAAAESAFMEAVTYDADDPRAALGLALVRHWSGRATAEWELSARAALRGAGALARPGDRFARALVAVADGDWASSCALWRSAADADAASYLAAYGTAHCLAKDHAVVRDARSPSNWSFRTSYREALAFYRRAFGQHPPVLEALREDGFSEMREIFKVGAVAYRSGLTGTDGPGAMFAAATYHRDTLAFVPLPPRLAFAPLTPAMAAGMAEAERRQREMFRDAAVSWTVSSPGSLAAREALAWSWALLAVPGAPDSLADARRHGPSGSPDASAAALRLAALEAFLRIHAALPADLASLRRGRVLADSVLASPGASRVLDPHLHAALAAFLGRAQVAIAIERSAATANSTGLSAGAAAPARAWTVAAAFGGPPSLLGALEGEVTVSAASGGNDASRRALARVAARAMTMAFHASGSVSVSGIDAAPDALLDAQRALARGDSAGARAGLASLGAARRGLAPAQLTVDALLAESQLAARVEGVGAARARLEPTLAALALADPRADPVHAASIVRALLWCATLSELSGDSAAAASWRAPARVLLGDLAAWPAPAALAVAPIRLNRTR